VAAAICCLVRWNLRGAPDGGEPLVRGSLVSVVSLATTTGFGVEDYDAWPPVLHIVLIVLMFCGACAGSTGGGGKITRLVIWWKAALRELRRLLRPTAVLMLKVDRRAIAEQVVHKSLAFLALVLVVWLGCTGVLMATGLSAKTALSASLASLSCVGPGFEAVGPTMNYAFVSDLGKWTLIVAMLLGRLELLSVLVLLSPMAWRR
jgi:trk system potassium uptake protein TrkH